MKKNIIPVVFFIFLAGLSTANAIGIRPDAIRIEFEPYFEETYNFQTETAENTQVYFEGALAKYVKVKKNNIKKDGSFVVGVKLPKEIKTPGDNIVYVGVTEGTKREGFVTGIASIKTAIVIKVPYPGIYAEVEFNAPNLNINETAHFVVSLTNLGKNDINNARAEIEVFDSNKNIVETLFTDEMGVKRKDTVKLKALFDASKHRAGPYKAKAHVTYADKSKDLEDDFKIGTLNVKIINYTRNFFEGKVGKFDIEVESAWNSKINNIFAEVKVFNNTKEVSSFKTISVSLKRWEKKLISTFWETQGLGEGTYDAEITLFYEEKKTKIRDVIEITIKEEKITGKASLVDYIAGMNLSIVAIILLIVVSVIIIERKFIRRKK